MDEVKPNSEPETLDAPSTFGGRRPSSGSPQIVYWYRVKAGLEVPVWSIGLSGKSYVRLRCPACGFQDQIGADWMKPDRPKIERFYICRCGVRSDAAAVYDLSETEENDEMTSPQIKGENHG